MKHTQKGNILLAVLLAAVIGAGGYYAYTKGDLTTNINLSKIGGTLQKLTTTDNPSVDENVSEGSYTSGDMELTITSPEKDSTVSGNKILVKGKTAAFADVFIGDQSTKADANGNFSLEVMLDEGLNNLIVSANDEEGNVAEQTVSVNLLTF